MPTRTRPRGHAQRHRPSPCPSTRPPTPATARRSAVHHSVCARSHARCRTPACANRQPQPPEQRQRQSSAARHSASKSRREHGHPCQRSPVALERHVASHATGTAPIRPHRPSAPHPHRQPHARPAHILLSSGGPRACSRANRHHSLVLAPVFPAIPVNPPHTAHASLHVHPLHTHGPTGPMVHFRQSRFSAASRPHSVCHFHLSKSHFRFSQIVTPPLAHTHSHPPHIPQHPHARTIPLHHHRGSRTPNIRAIFDHFAPSRLRRAIASPCLRTAPPHPSLPHKPTILTTIPHPAHNPHIPTHVHVLSKVRPHIRRPIVVAPPPHPRRLDTPPLSASLLTALRLTLTNCTSSHPCTDQNTARSSVFTRRILPAERGSPPRHRRFDPPPTTRARPALGAPKTVHIAPPAPRVHERGARGRGPSPCAGRRASPSRACQLRRRARGPA